MMEEGRGHGPRERWPGRGCSGLLCSGSGEELGEGEVIALMDVEVLFEVDACRTM